MAMTKYTTKESIWQRLHSRLDIAVERIRLFASANQMSVDELLVSLYTRMYVYVHTCGATWCFGLPTLTLLLRIVRTCIKGFCLQLTFRHWNQYMIRYKRTSQVRTFRSARPLTLSGCSWLVASLRCVPLSSQRTHWKLNSIPVPNMAWRCFKERSFLTTTPLWYVPYIVDWLNMNAYMLRSTKCIMLFTS